jgi:hypothetical protein
LPALERAPPLASMPPVGWPALLVAEPPLPVDTGTPPLPAPGRLLLAPPLLAPLVAAGVVTAPPVPELSSATLQAVSASASATTRLLANRRGRVVDNRPIPGTCGAAFRFTLDKGPVKSRN